MRTKGILRSLTMPAVIAGALAVPHLAVAASSLCDAVAGNLVANCGFELGVYSSTLTGDNGSGTTVTATNSNVPDDWTPNLGFDYYTGYNHTITNSNLVNSGSTALSIGNDDGELPGPPLLTQTLTDVAGEHYSGSVYVLYGGGAGNDPNAFFDVQVNGANVVSLNGGPTAPGTYTKYSFSFTGTGSDVLGLTADTNPNEWYTDDVVVTGVAAVPEPSTVWFLVVGVGALGLFRYWRGSTRTWSASAC